MTATTTTRRTDVRRPAAWIGLAAGLLAVLTACAANYEAACTDAGHAAGSAELRACVQERVETARTDRTRHLKYGSGGR